MPPAKCDKAKNKIEIILDTKTVFMCYFIFNLNLRLLLGRVAIWEELTKELLWKVKNDNCWLSFDDVDSAQHFLLVLTFVIFLDCTKLDVVIIFTK